jgi:carbamoyltransferase
MNRHEGKLTGLAAFGQPVLAAEIGRHFTVDESGLINSDFASDRAMRTELHALAEGREPADVAASIQAVLEERVLASVQRLLREHRVRHLALAGGVLSNVRLNRLLCEGTDVEEIFIFPGMGDEGLVVGGALEFLLERDGLPLWLKRRRRLSDVYWGRSHDDVIDSVLDGDARVAKLIGDPIETTVTLLGQGEAGAIYDGRMEFGPRALGARSILRGRG